MRTDVLGAPLLQLLLEMQALAGSFQLDVWEKNEPLKLFLRAEEAETVASCQPGEHCCCRCCG